VFAAVIAGLKEGWMDSLRKFFVGVIEMLLANQKINFRAER
jgi:hypothetical protein